MHAMAQFLPSPSLFSQLTKIFVIQGTNFVGLRQFYSSYVYSKYQ